MSTASGREVYVLGEEKWGNREVVIVEDGATHDLPASAKFAYSDVGTRFPYEMTA